MIDADLPLLRLQRCLSADLILRSMHAVFFSLFFLTEFLFTLFFVLTSLWHIFFSWFSFLTHACAYWLFLLFIKQTIYGLCLCFFHRKVHLVLRVCFEFSTSTPLDLFEENERCLQNVWSKPGLVAQGLQLMLRRCPSASHGAYECVVSKQIVYF